MNKFKTTIEVDKLTDKLAHRIAVSGDETTVYLTAEYDDGNRNFLIEKIFKNNYLGLEDLRVAKKKFDTEEKVLEYLGIKKKDE